MSQPEQRYDPQSIEVRWQERWERDGLYTTRDDDPRPKYYFLTMFPYPSGDLHLGHWYAETPPDTKARYMRMRGHNVLFPYGFDAFGLPAENAAIRNNVHPFKWTMANIDRMRRQAKRMGTMFDWSREVITCVPEYYKWNQWLFLQFYKAGLAYRQQAAVDWCPHCNTTLAREQVWGEDRHCERCGTPVTKRDLKQWFFRITRYAEELLDFSHLDWPDPVKAMQTNWIGRSEGATLSFATAELGPIRVFTTRPDTVYGVTFMVVAPEHELVAQLTTAEHSQEVTAYVEAARRQTEIERTATDKTKTGVVTGSYCTNPFSGDRVPVYVGDYVLPGYGTGAVMGVPAHDERDFEFAGKYGLEIKPVIVPSGGEPGPLEAAYVQPGVMVNSGEFDGTPSAEGKAQVVARGAAGGFAEAAITYRLRDWLVSRQRYWGTPIPIIYCPDCGTVPVPEEQLPVVLPEDADFVPTGESPLKRNDGFRKVACPNCGKDAERETDTMDTFVDSSWYQYRYLSPHYADGPFDLSGDKADWLPVSQYAGGIEHATMHLMYFRFFTKALRDIGLLPFGEPAVRLCNQGIILGPDGEKMSKSRGNVVNPEEYIDKYGADTFRCYLMFIGPWGEGGPYRPNGIEGVVRWLQRLWSLVLGPPVADNPDPAALKELGRQRHRTVQVVTQDLDGFRFNTMIARLMEFTTFLAKVRAAGSVSGAAWDDVVETLVLMVAPSAPHLAEELWQRTGHPYSVHQQAWPTYDESLVTADTFTLVVQINGKLRDRFEVAVGIDEDSAIKLAMDSDKVASSLADKTVRRVLFVPGRLVNIVAN